MKRYWRIHEVYDDEIWRKRQLLPEATRHEAILREGISPWKRGWKRMTRGFVCVKTGQETRNAGGKRSELRWNWSSVIFSNKRTIFLNLRSPASFFRYPFYNIIKKKKKKRKKKKKIVVRFRLRDSFCISLWTTIFVQHRRTPTAELFRYRTRSFILCRFL